MNMKLVSSILMTALLFLFALAVVLSDGFSAWRFCAIERVQMFSLMVVAYSRDAVSG